jgi:hypothetical protein
VRAYLNDNFLDPATGSYHDGMHKATGSYQDGMHKASQGGQGMALFMGIVPDGGAHPTPAPAPTPTHLCGKVAEDLQGHPTLDLACPAGQAIAAVTFASFGTPTGDCASGFAVNAKCNAAKSLAAVQSRCVGKAACSVPVVQGLCTAASPCIFGKDPCDGVAKSLAASVTCGPAAPTPPPPPPTPMPTLRAQALAVMADNARAAEFVKGRGQGPTVGGPGPHMLTGLFAVKWFLMSLSDGGLNDLAYEVVTTPSFPSYSWMMHNEFANATTIWEAWFFSNNTFSHNHPMFASTEVWMQQSVLGIQPHPAARGMHRVLIKPRPPTKLARASGSFETPRGKISVSWSWGGRQSWGGGGADADSAVGAGVALRSRALQLNVTVPPNTMADFSLPSADGQLWETAVETDAGTGLAANVRRLVSGGSATGEFVEVALGSGSYQLETSVLH